MGGNGKLVSLSGRPLDSEEIEGKTTEKVATDEKGHVKKIVVNGKELEIVNTVTMMEIVIHKLVDGTELQQVIAHEFMMVDHKPYMVRMLTEAINTVMKTKKRKSSIAVVGQALMNKINRSRMKDIPHSGKFRRKR